ncbi:MAG TPA: hypothetical protein VJN29_18880 [Intrasporangium sp.]|uniref:hypothetical protein n=1 Tax=Intrasporangium sp. TaxID=1925024 RepID=UPI002B4A8650|nr:hypothetical protein [Intrasporangium sp.]HKX69284.1 hypothetical protein [Intrasporangium sp.]
MTDGDLLLNPHDRALGRAAVASGRLLNDLGGAHLEAAGNLVEKAARALETGDEAKAERYLERACAYPYDERELLHHGPWAAHMFLHDEVTDAFVHSHVDDEEWLDVALEQAATGSGLGREHLADILHELSAQARFYELTPRESRRIRKALGKRSMSPDFRLAADASIAEQVAVARELIETALRFHRALHH